MAEGRPHGLTNHRLGCSIHSDPLSTVEGGFFCGYRGGMHWYALTSKIRTTFHNLLCVTYRLS